MSWFRAGRLIVPLLLLAFSGCYLLKERPVTLDIAARTYPADEYTTVKRVLVMPFSNETEFEGEQRLVENAFATALAERGCFEVVSIPPEDKALTESIRPYTTGRVPLTLLIELGEYYQVDAVLLGCLKRYDPYSPPLIALKADVIAIANGEVLRTVNGLLDARENDVVRDMSDYYERGCSRHESLFEWHLITSSPEMFARYAGHRFVAALYPPRRPVQK